KPLLRPMRLASQRAVVMHDDERVRPDVRAMIADERARCGRGQCRFCAHLREAKPDWWEVCEDPSGIELTPMCMFCGPKERKAWLDGRSDQVQHSKTRRYARARESLMDWYAEEILKIAFDDSGDLIIDGDRVMSGHHVVQRARLKVDTVKWIMAKLAPKKYGD